MKSLILSIACLLAFIRGDCVLPSQDCHTRVRMKNNSGAPVVVAILVQGGSGGCILDGTTVVHGSYYDYQPFLTCIEKDMSDRESLEIFIVDPSKFNEPNVHYDCDSIEVKNLVLRRILLKLNDLKANNFTVVYP